MPTEEQIKERLGEVLVPGAMRSLTELNLVRSISIEDGSIKVTLASAAIPAETQDWLKAKVGESLKKLDGVKEAETDFLEAKPGELNDIRRVVAVMSGKGGVGKSLMAALSAMALNRQGYKVGILDADITGPSIPKMFGIAAHPSGSANGITPVLTRSGISIMSINLLLEHEDDAVVWRGPLIGRAIQQFWEEVLWGYLDCLVVDLPPGTADAPLTVLQTLPVSGVLIVFSPQELAAMVVRKALKMAQTMNKPVLGLVENMSYFVLPETQKRIEIFGKSSAEEMAQTASAPLLGQFPLDPELAQLCDEGNIEHYSSDAFAAFAQAFAPTLSLESD